MKVEVVQDFKDKNTLDIHKKGDIIELESQRCAEINSTPLGVFVSEVIEPIQVENETQINKPEVQKKKTTKKVGE